MNDDKVWFCMYLVAVECGTYGLHFPEVPVSRYVDRTAATTLVGDSPVLVAAGNDWAVRGGGAWSKVEIRPLG